MTIRPQIINLFFFVLDMQYILLINIILTTANITISKIIPQKQLLINNTSAIVKNINISKTNNFVMSIQPK